MEDEIKQMQESLKATQEELAHAKVVIGTLIIYMQGSIGYQNATDLMEQLDS